MGARGLGLQEGDIRLVVRHMDREDRGEGHRMLLVVDRQAGSGPGAGIGREGGTARQPEEGMGSAIRVRRGEEEECRIGLEGARSPKGVGRSQRAAAGTAAGARDIAGTVRPGMGAAGAQLNGEDIRRWLGEQDFLLVGERRMEREAAEDGLDRRRGDTRRGSPEGEGPASTGRSYSAADKT